MFKIKNLSALCFNMLMGIFIAASLGAAPVFGVVGSVGTSLLLSGAMPKGVALGSIHTEVWTGELVKKLRAGAEATFLNGVPDYSSRSENDVIHLVEIGADPDVLVNNTTYPIAIQALPDDGIAISLDKFQTKATVVTDDELYAISYNKMAVVIENHGEAINETKYKKAIHAFAPQQDSSNTPVLKTTGDADVEAGRKKLKREDIIALKKKFDKLRVPQNGRRLVLCPDHVADLLEQDQKFAAQYYNYTTGKIANLYGFEVFEFVNCPHYDNTGKKIAWNATIGETDFQASVAFYTKHMFQATGTTKMYYSEARINPTTQQSLTNFRHYFVALPKVQKAIGAIISAAV